MQLAAQVEDDSRDGREEDPDDAELARRAAAASLAFALALFAPRSHAARAGRRPRAASRRASIRRPSPLLTKVPASDSDWVAAQRELVARLRDHRQVRRGGGGGAPRGAVRQGRQRALESRSAKCCITRGKRAAAESAFVRAGAEHAPDSLTAALNLAVLHFDRGDRDQRDEGVRPVHRRLQRDRLGDDLTSDELMAVAIAVRIPRRERPAAVQGCAEGVRPRD